MKTNKEALQKLPNDAARNALIEIINNNIPLSKHYNIIIEDGAAKGDNYIGIVHRITITYKDESSETKKLGIFLKVPPENLFRRKTFFSGPCFLREILMYNEFLPLLEEFQEYKKVLPEERFKEYGKCLKNLTDDLNEAIFMEDLTLKGFQMKSRFENPPLEVIKLVMKTLGKFHALSFALKDQWPEKFAKFRGLEEIFNRSEEAFINYINDLKEIAFEALSNEGDERYLEQVKLFAERNPFYYKMCELVDGSKVEPYAVVCHGDCWNNNMLFKFENGVPVDMKLIDWQISRFASPVCDLMYYIFAHTSASMRKTHYQNILDVYYKQLSLFLERLGSDPKILFPRKELDNQLKQNGSLALIMDLMLIPTMLTKAENVVDLNELSEKMEAGDEEFVKNAMQNKDPETYSKLREVIIDLVNLGYLE